MFKRKSSALPNPAPDLAAAAKAEFERDLAEFGPFQALLKQLKRDSAATDFNEIMSEIMFSYPDPLREPNPELHLLLGIQKLKTAAPAGALIEFKKVPFDFLRDHAAKEFLECLLANNLRTGFLKTVSLFLQSAPTMEAEILNYLKTVLANSSLREALNQCNFSEAGKRELEKFIQARTVPITEKDLLILEPASLNSSDSAESKFDSLLEFQGFAAALKNQRLRPKRLPSLHEVAPSNSTNRLLISGHLTADSFEFTESLRPIFISVSILDEKLLNARNLSLLQKSSPILAADIATSQLLSSFEVPNFVIGKFAMHNQIHKSRKPLGELWFDINQWAPKEISRKTSADFDWDYTPTNPTEREIKRAVSSLLAHQKIKTSSVALAEVARANGNEIEYKPKSRFRTSNRLSPEPLLIRKKQQQVLQIIQTANTATAALDQLKKTFEIEIRERQTEIRLPQPLPASSIPQSVLDTVKANVETFGIGKKLDRHLHIAFGFDQNLVPAFAPVLRQLVANGSFSADIHVLARGFTANDLVDLAVEFSHFKFHIYPFDFVDYGASVNTLDHITVSTMDRLFLPELLRDIDQVVYLDTDLAVLGDVWEIGSLPLQRHALAARLINTTVWGSGWKTFQKAAAKIDLDFADKLRATLLANENLISCKFVNAGVLVMNLRLMRSENFTQNYLGLIEFARFNDQDVLSLYARGRILELGLEWNYTVSHSEITQPKIVHWAGPKKPWKSEFVWFKSEFEKYLEPTGDI